MNNQVSRTAFHVSDVLEQRKGVYGRMVDYGKMFAKINNPIIVNDLAAEKEMDRADLSNLIRTSYDGDSISVLPTCECGELHGATNLNEICDACGTPCVSAIDRPIESTVWIRAPEGVRALIQPVVWTILCDAFRYTKLCIPEWICTTQGGQYSNVQRGTIERLQQLGFGRGLNWFIDNFDWVIQTLIENKMYSSAYQTIASRDSLLKLLYEHGNRNKIFTKMLPVPNKIAFITEQTNVGMYVDTGTLQPVMDAVRTIASIDETEYGTKQQIRENRAAKAIMQFAEFYEWYVKKCLGPKEGWYRKHIFGNRIIFSGRAVVTSLSENHEDDELHVPWGFAIALFKLDLTNKLFKLGYTPCQIETMIISSAHTYNELLDRLLNELIAESPYGGIPVLFLRNPSLHKTSIQCLRITKVKKDPRIRSISIGLLVIAGPNCDFDGDEMSLARIMDHQQYEYLSKLQPYLSAFDLSEPRKISGINDLPKPLISTIRNWLQLEGTC